MLAMVLFVCACISGPIPAQAENENTDYSQYDVSKYDAGIYTAPYWEGNVIVNESVFPLTAKDGTLAPFKLVYPATKILYVKNYTLDKTYVEGKDYMLNSDGELVILPTGSIETFSYRYIHPNTNPNNYDWNVYYPRRDEPGIEPGWEFWEESSRLSRQLIAVTYVHDDNVTINRPAAVGTALPKTMEKLSSGQNLRIVTCGDSVTQGAQASSFLGISPHAPIYPKMLQDALRLKWDNQNVTVLNSGIGGATSEWSADVLNQTIIDKKPDLVTMCYGMNDSSFDRIGYTDAKFRNNIVGQIEYVKSKLPDVEILLVSSIYGNIYTFDRSRYESHARVLSEIAEEYKDRGVAFTDPQAIERQMMARKEFVDFMGDNMVHPNDFGMRLITQTITESLRYGSVADAASDALKKLRKSVEAARGKEELYEKMLEDARLAFAALDSEEAINTELTKQLNLLTEAMKYCADGYHGFRSVHIAPRCDADGVCLDSCIYCGIEKNRTVIPALPGPHLLGESIVSVTATELNAGKTERHCLKCAYVEEQTVPALGDTDVNHMYYADFGYNYMASSFKPFSRSGTVILDVLPIDVSQRSDPSGPCYVGAWIGQSYTIVAGYDFDLQQFIVARNDLPFSASPTDANIYARKDFAWVKKTDGTYDEHRIAINVARDTVRIFCDGTEVLSVKNSAFMSTAYNTLLLYSKGEFALDDIKVSSHSQFDPATESGTVLWSEDFENGLTEFNSKWTLGGYTTVHVDPFSLNGHYTAPHNHNNVSVAKHSSSCIHAAYEEFECTLCGERTTVQSEPSLGRHVFISRTENESEYEYHCLFCDEIIREPKSDDGASIIVAGDADGSGTLNARDVVTIMRKIVGWECDTRTLLAADFNGDGRINARDILMMLTYFVDDGIPREWFK